MKKFGKILLVLLLVPAMVISCAVPACADLIWEPDEEFYFAHIEEVETVRRGYEFAGAGGRVAFYSRPGETVLKEFENGEGVNVSYTWSDGTELWGCTMARLEEGGKYTEGWVRMEDMLLIYDSEEFFQDHEEEIKRENLSVQLDTVKLFSYPNGPERDTWEDDFSRERPDFEAEVYTDDAGHRWAHINYWHGVRDSWVCLDEPMIEGAAERKYVPTPEQEARAAAKERQKTLILAAVLVLAVVIVTVVLIRKLPKRKESAPKGEEDLS